MKKAKRPEAKKVVRPADAARQLWPHLQERLKVDEALAALIPEDASRSAFKVKRSAD